MIVDRDRYCRDCDRSIWGDKSCDVNVVDNGYYYLADEKCYCKIVNGVRAEKYPWEESKPDFVNKKLHLPIFPKDNQDPLRSSLKLDTTPDDSKSEMWAKENPWYSKAIQDHIQKVMQLEPVDLVCAVFEKPRNCAVCPCSHYLGDPFLNDICQLKRYTDGFDSDCELGFECGVEPPDWCPLNDVKVIKEQ